MRWTGWVIMIFTLCPSAVKAVEPWARCPRLTGSEETALVLSCAPGRAPLVESRAGKFVPTGLLPWPPAFSAVGFRVHFFELGGKSFTVVEVDSQNRAPKRISLRSACVLEEDGRDTGVGFPMALDNPCGQSYRAAWSIRLRAGDAVALCVTSIDWPRENADCGERGTTGTWPICGDLTVGESWFRLDPNGALVSMDASTYRILAGLRPAVAPPAPGRDAALHRSLAALSVAEREELETSLVRWRTAMVDGWQEGAHTLRELRALRSINILAYSLGGIPSAQAPQPSSGAGETEPQTDAAPADERVAKGAGSNGTPNLTEVSLARRGTAP
jgi:hypothetical protein